MDRTVAIAAIAAAIGTYAVVPSDRTFGYAWGCATAVFIIRFMGLKKPRS